MKIMCFFILTAVNITLLANNININGIINIDEEDITIILTKLDEEETEIASIELEGNEFSIDFSAKTSELYLLEYGSEGTEFLVLHPGDNIKLVIDSNNIQVDGSKELTNYFEMNQSLAPILDEYDELYNAYMYEEEDEELLRIKSEVDALLIRYKELIIDYINKNSSSLLALIYVEELDIDEDFELYQTISSNLYSKYPENVYVKDLKQRVEAAQKTAIGSLAPDISMPTPDGKTINLSDLRGKIVLIDFWAAWCGPCRRESPNMVKLYEEYNKHGFEIFGVSLDTEKERWTTAIEDDKLIWTQVSDLLGWDSKAQELYGFEGIPYTVLIDKEGKIIAKGLRGEALAEKLEEIFGK
jgi:peroxiredoxin